MNKNRKKNRETESTAEAKLKGFLDMIAPSVIQFYTDHYICGNTYRSVLALREYPTATDEQAILRHLGEKDGVTLRIYTRPEFDNDLVRRLIASIKVVSADKLIIQFQSGIVMEQEISYD